MPTCERLRAVNWAFDQRMKPSTDHHVLLALAAGVDAAGTTSPGVARLSDVTGLDRKAVMRSQRYEIEPNAAAAWFAEHRKQAAPPRTALNERQVEAIKNLVGDGFPGLEIGLTSKEQEAAIDAAIAGLDYRQRMNSLLEAEPTVGLLVDAIVRLRSALEPIGAAVRRRYQLDRDAEEWIREEHSRAVQVFVTRLDEIMTPA